jgi:hypothetical protein
VATGTRKPVGGRHFAQLQTSCWSRRKYFYLNISQEARSCRVLIKYGKDGVLCCIISWPQKLQRRRLGASAASEKFRPSITRPVAFDVRPTLYLRGTQSSLFFLLLLTTSRQLSAFPKSILASPCYAKQLGIVSLRTQPASRRPALGQQRWRASRAGPTPRRTPLWRRS